MTPNDKPKRTDSRIEQIAKRARQKRRTWKKHPVLTSAVLAERATRRVVKVAGRASEKARRTAYSYAVAYGSGRGSSLATWARQRRAWLQRVAGPIELDTSEVSRVFKPGMTPRRRALYAAARTRRHVAETRRRVDTARSVAGRHLTRAAGELAASDSRGVRRFARPVRGVADRVSPGRYRCPRCGASYRNTTAWTAHECIRPHGMRWKPIGAPHNPDNPTHTDRNSNRNSRRNHGRTRNTHRNTRSETFGGPAMSNPGNSGHPAQLIGRGGVTLAPLAPTTDTELIWTLERLSAACQMVGNGAVSFAENLDLMGLDPRVVEPLKGFAQHMAEGAAFPLGAHRALWALYGHRIEPAQGAGRAVKVQNFFGDQRSNG